jgi:ribosomal protein S26
VGRKKKESVECGRKGCVDCKQAICGSKVFCGWLKKFVNESRVSDGVEIVVCPRFEMEPLEYKVYRRA